MSQACTSQTEHAKGHSQDFAHSALVSLVQTAAATCSQPTNIKYESVINVLSRADKNGFLGTIMFSDEVTFRTSEEVHHQSV